MRFDRTLWYVLTLCLAFVQDALAHPMGNFSISHYSNLKLGPAALDLLYMIDMAEVPTFQEKAELDGNGDGTLDTAEKQRYLAKKADELTQGLFVSVNGRRATWERVSGDIELLPGGLNLPTLKLTLRYRSAWDHASLKDINQVEFQDQNFAGRAGWKEVVVEAADGVRLLESSAPATDLSRQLTVYPEDPSIRPPEDVSATLKFALNSPLPVQVPVAPVFGQPPKPSKSHILLYAVTFGLAVVVAGVGALWMRRRSMQESSRAARD
jgi:hypothetical protein